MTAADSEQDPLAHWKNDPDQNFHGTNNPKKNLVLGAKNRRPQRVTSPLPKSGIDTLHLISVGLKPTECADGSIIGTRCRE
jgi:hypothetical protein